jgi:hypothetical protein
MLGAFTKSPRAAEFRQNGSEFERRCIEAGEGAIKWLPKLGMSLPRKVFELKEAESSDDGSIILTDGKVRLLIRRCHTGLYRSLRQGLDHIGFKVENMENAKKDLDEITATFPESTPRRYYPRPNATTSRTKRSRPGWQTTPRDFFRI